MRSKARENKSVRIAAAMALSLGLAVLAMPRAANAVSVCEGDSADEPTGAFIPSGVHSVSIGLVTPTIPAGVEKFVGTPTDCVTLDGGTSVTVYDTTCVIGGKTLNPCVVQATGNVTVAVSDNCDLATGKTLKGASTSGQIASVATSGPLLNCVSSGGILPWSSEAGNFIIGQGQTTTFTGATPACPNATGGGTGFCISHP